jgi:glycosyltransferase involved in cell wall biosynthesis
MHYAVPRILEAAGMLDRLYTDIHAEFRPAQAVRSIIPEGLMPSGLRSLLDRVPEGIPKRKIISFPLFGIRSALRRNLQTSLALKTKGYLQDNKKFGSLVTSRLDTASDAVYTFKGASLEILNWCDEHGSFAVLEQPNVHRPVMAELLAEETEDFERWSVNGRKDPHVQEEAIRERAEWQLADLIVCPSHFVRDGIEKSGGPADRTVVVPYGVPFEKREEARVAPSRELRILTVGTVGLRKGAPYLFKASKATKHTFRWVGSVNLTPWARNHLSQHIDLRGRVPRSEIHKHYDWADIFILPSLCEGSATVVYEALSYGLPVICTSNTGSIVRDGKEGFIVPIRSSEAIVDRVQKLRRSPSLYEEMSLQALKRYRSMGSIESYKDRLTAAIREGFTSRSHG